MPAANDAPVLVGQRETLGHGPLERAARDERQVLAHDAHRGTRSAGPVAQPTFQPVIDSDLPALPIVTVRSAIPGIVAKGTCSWPVNTRCSYDLVADHQRSCSAHDLGDRERARAGEDDCRSGCAAS